MNGVWQGRLSANWSILIKEAPCQDESPGWCWRVRCWGKRKMKHPDRKEWESWGRHIKRKIDKHEAQKWEASRNENPASFLRWRNVVKDSISDRSHLHLYLEANSIKKQERKVCIKSFLYFSMCVLWCIIHNNKNKCLQEGSFAKFPFFLLLFTTALFSIYFFFKIVLVKLCLIRRPVCT